ncbi:hypothetical protein SEVIR_8G112616v4 [Setaria viridis]
MHRHVQCLLASAVATRVVEVVTNQQKPPQHCSTLHF